LAVSDLTGYMAVAASIEPPVIHFIRRPGQHFDDALILMTLLPDAQGHFSCVSLMEREGHLLFWNESVAVQLEMSRGTFIRLRSHLLWRKYLLVSPIGQVPMVEDLDAAVYVPYQDFNARFRLKILGVS
jgi:hypothetical protein